ncbi:glutathione S-transferase U10-like [Ananas comosus]|uniref:Glutathione S-transferase n=1 Tax=Ananas comosus TaxID=4615 RepID=A0A199V1I6_ANACO|nr:glutathione S-transferase U10-like [Ananas comosus]OAY70740.1 Glutathione S-transferase U10 [Ananas comosus]
MEEVKEVKLHGYVKSGYSTMVHYALRLKGVCYEYVEEDLKNKSEELLSLNPVYKKVPVLVVDGRPIAESLIILEFVDEVWKDNNPFLPQDPYERAKVRFWAQFFYQKLVPGGYAIRNSEGEARKKAAEEFVDSLIILEEGLRKDLYTGVPFIHGERPGLLDVILSGSHSTFNYLGGLAGVKLLEKERMPILCSSLDAFVELDAIKSMAQDFKIPKPPAPSAA